MYVNISVALRRVLKEICGLPVGRIWLALTYYKTNRGHFW